MENKNIWIIGILILVVILFLQRGELQTFIAAPIDTATISRSMPNEANTGATFTVTYTPAGFGTGNWGVLIEDTVTGGCTPSTYRTGKFSDDTRPYTQVFTAPSTAGTCTFAGTYEFAGSTKKVTSGSTSITIKAPITCADLKIDAATAIQTWVNNPTSTNRQLALDAILLWVNC